MPKQTGFEDRLKCNNFKMPPLCAWCGSRDVIGTYPVVIDKSRVVRMRFEFLKYEDRIYCFSFPICRQCKTQIKFRRTLDNRAIQFVVVLGIITTILLSTIHHNIGFSIFAGFCASLFVFGIYLMLKNIILSSLHQVNERSWGSCDGERLSFRIQEFEKEFNELNPNITSINK